MVRMFWCIFLFGPFLAYAIVLLTFVRPSRFSPRVARMWEVGLLICFSKFLAFRLLGRHAFVPDLPEIVVWAWGWAYSGAMILTCLSLVWWVRAHRVAVLALTSWGLAAWGVANGIVVSCVHEVAIEIPRLPVELDGYRIVQLSDLHISSAARAWRTKSLVRRTNDLKPDLICVTGDIVDGPLSHRADDVLPLTELHAKDGVYYVKGNHEYFCDRVNWENWYAAHGFRFLDNTCAFPRAGLALGGVEDIRSLGEGAEMPDPARAFAAATNGEFRVLMQHRPVNAPEPCPSCVPTCPVDLQLSGHTHGGVMPGMARIVAAFNGGWVRGLYPTACGLIYVSAGSGQWAGFPIRFCNPSEITLLTLRRVK